MRAATWKTIQYKNEILVIPNTEKIEAKFSRIKQNLMPNIVNFLVTIDNPFMHGVYVQCAFPLHYLR